MQHFDDAAVAVKEEYRQTSRCRRLKCRGVRLVSSDGGEELFCLDVGRHTQFDWTWEGASAFRPLNVDGDDGGLDVPTTWKGVVVEVEADKGLLYVSCEGSEPRAGVFFVKPVEFLAALHAVFNSPEHASRVPELTRFLLLASGDQEPERINEGYAGLPELAAMWSHSWCLLWGPPGTGKTYTIAQQVARLVLATKQRILVVSTTNRATDEVAIQIGKAIRQRAPSFCLTERVMRVGSGAGYSDFERAGMKDLLYGQSHRARELLDQAQKELQAASAGEEKARLRVLIQKLKAVIRDPVAWAFEDNDCQVVVTTAFSALLQLTSPECPRTPFGTVVVDEAGLISRAGVAALAMLASTRTVLAGDPKQLAPISAIARVLPSHKSRWLAESGLGHLESVAMIAANSHLLAEQHRMCSTIRQVVSAYQYEGKLTDAPSVVARNYDIDAVFLSTMPRAIWYVLDDDAGGYPPAIRASRGPGNQSWVRDRTPEVVRKIFSRHPGLRVAGGVFLSPFVAQVRNMQSWFVREGVENWRASTVHSLQGLEANHVMFDTVNAGSTAWPFDEWKRLVNVALSRAREILIVLASRQELAEPYLAPLRSHLAPRVLEGGMWRRVEAEERWEPVTPISQRPGSIGFQLEQRRMLRPIMSREQQRLCGYEMDGKPRLVRGVAGSGKTLVLANWLARTIAAHPSKTAWVVYGNMALMGLLRDTIETAWRDLANGADVPWRRIQMVWIQEVLDRQLRRVGTNVGRFDNRFDYDKIAGYCLGLMKEKAVAVEQVCDALFVDEGQDMGPETLRLLNLLVRPGDATDGHRQVMIFYDNAQNLYGRPVPKWADLGIDMRGRSYVMEESFRSTRPITEFALNVLYSLEDPESDPDHKELVKRELIEQLHVDGSAWWRVHFNQVEGPTPTVRKFVNRDRELLALADSLHSLVVEEGVTPRDIKVICNGERERAAVVKALAKRLTPTGCKVLEQRSQTFEKSPAALIVTTAHSFKGYDAEVVAIPAVDRFAVRDGLLAKNLYVAMTRARSILYVSGIKTTSEDAGNRILAAIETCQERGLRLVATGGRRGIADATTAAQDREEILARIGAEHGDWLAAIWDKYRVNQDAITGGDGEILGEPLFWFDTPTGKRVAVYPPPGVGEIERERLDDVGVVVAQPGDVAF